MYLQQVDATCVRLTGATKIEPGFDGPKHHAVLLGLTSSGSLLRDMSERPMLQTLARHS